MKEKEMRWPRSITGTTLFLSNTRCALICTPYIIYFCRTYVPLKRSEQMNRTERYIKKLFLSLGINCISQLNIKELSNKLNLDVLFWNYGSELAYYNGCFKVFINNNQSMQCMWQDFGHEIYHYLNDQASYDLLHPGYYLYGECKADYFAYHFCVPTFMLNNFKEVSVNVIANRFNVEYDFALRRFEMYQNKILIGGM